MAAPPVPRDFRKPKTITGGCLCGSIRYKVDFPRDHNFLESSWSCQCTQCRRATGALVFYWHTVPRGCLAFVSSSSSSSAPAPAPAPAPTPAPASWRNPAAAAPKKTTKTTTTVTATTITFTQDPPAALKNFAATEPGYRCFFCARCGATLFWRAEARDDLDLAIGSVDPEFLHGVPEAGVAGYGYALANCHGPNVVCGHTIKGVTDVFVGKLTGNKHY